MLNTMKASKAVVILVCFCFDVTEGNGPGSGVKITPQGYFVKYLRVSKRFELGETFQFLNLVLKYSVKNSGIFDYFSRSYGHFVSHD